MRGDAVGVVVLNGAAEALDGLVGLVVFLEGHGGERGDDAGFGLGFVLAAREQQLSVYGASKAMVPFNASAAAQNAPQVSFDIAPPGGAAPPVAPGSAPPAPAPAQ